MPLKNDPIAITIRRAAIADAGQICAIEQDASTIPWPSSAFERELSNEHGGSYVALDETNKVCAYIISVLVSDELHIHNLAVQEQFRRRSIASRLIDRVMELASLRGVEKAYLEVRSKNGAAIALYEKCGFSTQLIRKKYYSDDQDDALIMERNIGSGPFKNLIKFEPLEK